MGDVLDFEAHRAARVGVAATSASEPKADDFATGWLCRLDVFAPAQPGGEHRAAFLDFNLADGLDAPARLELIAGALEQIAGSLRRAARADAV